MKVLSQESALVVTDDFDFLVRGHFLHLAYISFLVLARSFYCVPYFRGLPLLLPFVCNSFIVGLPYTTMWTTLRERLRDLVSILLNEFNKVRPRMANLEWANIDQLCTLEEATHLSQKMREAFEDNG